MVKIDKEYYYIDLEEIMSYIFKEVNKNVSEEETIINSKDALVQKTVFNKNVDDKYANIRYDMIKSMLDVLYTSGVESEEGNIKYVQDMDENSIGTKLIFNTMLENEFIKNKLD